MSAAQQAYEISPGVRVASSGPFTVEDAIDGVPGAGKPSDYPQSQPARHDPREEAKKPTPGYIEEQVHQELADSLDDGTPVSDQEITSHRWLAVDQALDQIAEIIPARHAQEVREALAKAYDLGCQNPDPMRQAAPDQVKVLLTGLPPHDANGKRLRGEDFWVARRIPSEGRGPYYAMVGDPNAVAVGRFKASFRKFLGLSE